MGAKKLNSEDQTPEGAGIGAVDETPCEMPSAYPNYSFMMTLSFLDTVTFSTALTGFLFASRFIKSVCSFYWRT